MDLSFISVRQARAEDSIAIQALYLELTQDNNVHVIPAEIDAALDDPRTYLIIAEADGKAIGTALVTLCRDVMYGEQPFAVVENIVVTENSRGAGVGTKLLEYIESYCRNGNCTKIMLLSSASRLDAHRFFERCGFESDKKRGFVKYRRNFLQS